MPTYVDLSDIISTCQIIKSTFQIHVVMFTSQVIKSTCQIMMTTYLIYMFTSKWQQSGMGTFKVVSEIHDYVTRKYNDPTSGLDMTV